MSKIKQLLPISNFIDSIEKRPIVVKTRFLKFYSIYRDERFIGFMPKNYALNGSFVARE